MTFFKAQEKPKKRGFFGRLMERHEEKQRNFEIKDPNDDDMKKLNDDIAEKERVIAEQERKYK